MEATKISGVYKITNINTQKVYIGSSIDIERRHKDHLRMLNTNTHHSCKLQQSFNRTKDKNVFQFEIIEEVEDQNNLKVREQYYIDSYDAFNNGYNCSAQVDNPKYTYRYEKGKEKGRIKEERYQEFIELINLYEDKLKFKNIFKTRLLDRHYSSSVYLSVNNMIKWFLDNYSINYNARIDVRNNKQYHLLVSDKNRNEFACYKYYEEQIFNSLCDTKALINNLGKKGIYKKIIHYIVDVPNFNY